MDGFDALSFGVRHQGFRIVNGPPQRQRSLVGHVANPHQVPRFHGRFRPVNTSDHTIGTVHQKGNGAVVNLNPLQGLHVSQEAAQCEEDAPLILFIQQFNDQRGTVDEHHGPRPVLGHLKKRPVDVEVNAQVCFQFLEQRRNVFATHGSTFADAPFVGHGVHEGLEAIILGHRVLDEPHHVSPIMAMWCTIRTFSKHALELGNQPAVEPILFVKPAACLHGEGPIPVSQHPGEVHHEVECVLRVNAGLEPVAIAVGLDLTDRATQSELRAEQLPWAKAKCFTSSAVVGGWSPWNGTWEDIVDINRGLHLLLEVNGTVRQSTPLHEMSVTPRQQIESLRSWAPVVEGDLLFTGTPQGVGELLPGDRVVARLTDADGACLSEIDVGCV